MIQFSIIFFSTETAINIGYSCQLLTDDLIDLFIVDGETHQEVEKQLDKFKESIRIVNTYHPHGESRFNKNFRYFSYSFFTFR